MIIVIVRTERPDIEFFTKEGQLVLDPMAGTGSALIAAVQCNRSAIGIELNNTYADIAKKRVRELLDEKHDAGIQAEIYCEDALNMDDLKIPKAIHSNEKFCKDPGNHLKIRYIEHHIDIRVRVASVNIQMFGLFK